MFATRLDEIKGQSHVKRALEVAMVGEHTVTLWAPGTGLDAEELAAVARRLGLEFSEVMVAVYCPCGNFGSTETPCTCSSDEIRQYMRQLRPYLASDIHTKVERVSFVRLTAERAQEPDERIIERVEEARGREVSLSLDTASLSLMEAAMRQLRLGQVQYRRILAVAGSIAKLAGSDSLRPIFVAEALQYRLRMPDAPLPQNEVDLGPITEELRVANAGLTLIRDEIAGLTDYLAQSARETKTLT